MARSIDCFAQPGRRRTELAVGEGKNAELDLRHQFQAPLFVEGEQLQQQPINEFAAGQPERGDPGGDPILDELQAVLPKGVLRSK
ncbi:hypothetical protein StoSoilB20_03480 [Arthrobacter sp. StoSoilB20]|nr:hypothetical protein StoSoilB20_03480 [Arthrobacter sp. StoSoilB20]